MRDVEMNSIESFCFLFNYLWSSEGQKKAKFQIVDTILFKDGSPHMWLFTSEKSGEIMKKKNERLKSSLEIVQAIKVRSRGLKGFKQLHLRTKIASIWYMQSKKEIINHLVDEFELQVILENHLLEVIAVQVFMGGFPLKGNGTFEHRMSIQKDGVTRQQTTELIDPIIGLGFDPDTTSTQLDRLVVTEQQHNSITTLTRRIISHIEPAIKARISNIMLQVVFNSAWVPYVVSARAVSLTGAPMEFHDIRDSMIFPWGKAPDFPSFSSKSMLLPAKGPMNNSYKPPKHVTKELPVQHQSMSLRTLVKATQGIQHQHSHSKQSPISSPVKLDFRSSSNDKSEIGKSFSDDNTTTLSKKSGKNRPKPKTDDFKPVSRMLQSSSSPGKLSDLLSKTMPARPSSAVEKNQNQKAEKSKQNRPLSATATHSPFQTNFSPKKSPSTPKLASFSEAVDEEKEFDINNLNIPDPLPSLGPSSIRYEASGSHVQIGSQQAIGSQLGSPQQLRNRFSSNPQLLGNQGRSLSLMSFDAKETLGRSYEDLGQKQMEEDAQNATINLLTSGFQQKNVKQQLYAKYDPNYRMVLTEGMLKHPSTSAKNGVMRTTEASVYRMTHYSNQIKEEDGRLKDLTRYTKRPISAPHASRTSLLDMDLIFDRLDQSDLKNSITAPRRGNGINKVLPLSGTTCFGSYCDFASRAQMGAVGEGEPSRVPLKQRRCHECPHKLSYKSILLARAETEFIKAELDENVEGLVDQLKLSDLSADQLYAYFVRRHLNRVAQKCQEEARIVAFAPTQVSYGVKADLNAVYRRLIYADALSHVHPSRFYYTVPLCEMCFRIYSFMDIHRETIVLHNPEHTPFVPPSSPTFREGKTNPPDNRKMRLSSSQPAAVRAGRISTLTRPKSGSNISPRGNYSLELRKRVAEAKQETEQNESPRGGNNKNAKKKDDKDQEEETIKTLQKPLDKSKIRIPKNQTDDNNQDTTNDRGIGSQGPIHPDLAVTISARGDTISSWVKLLRSKSAGATRNKSAEMLGERVVGRKTATAIAIASAYGMNSSNIPHYLGGSKSGQMHLDLDDPTEGKAKNKTPSRPQSASASIAPTRSNTRKNIPLEDSLELKLREEEEKVEEPTELEAVIPTHQLPVQELSAMFEEQRRLKENALKALKKAEEDQVKAKRAAQRKVPETLEDLYSYTSLPYSPAPQYFTKKSSKNSLHEFDTTLSPVVENSITSSTTKKEETGLLVTPNKNTESFSSLAIMELSPMTESVSPLKTNEFSPLPSTPTFQGPTPKNRPMSAPAGESQTSLRGSQTSLKDGSLNVSPSLSGDFSAISSPDQIPIPRKQTPFKAPAVQPYHSRDHFPLGNPLPPMNESPGAFSTDEQDLSGEESPSSLDAMGAAESPLTPGLEGFSIPSPSALTPPNYKYLY